MQQYEIYDWVYQNEGDNICDKCKEHQGKRFDKMQDAPKLPIHPNCRCHLKKIYQREGKPYLLFNGKILKLIWAEEVIKSWNGVSGKPGYQHPEDTDKKNKGPIPEGEYKVRPDIQYTDNRSDWDKFKGIFYGGTFPGGEKSWGDGRVWLDPKKGTDTKGRSGFSIHGGTYPGSIGCIDLTSEIKSFLEEFRSISEIGTIDLIVQYKK
ncbi:MAG: DUF2778 domain-containing protein [Alphaproteobacteria bacterium]|nr:DUF2778 domain-containing protein [Alphaproteobacteria bacterium]